MNTLIERATESDLPAILRLQKTCYQSEADLYNDPAIPPLLQTLDSLKEEFSCSTFLKVTDGNSIIASVRTSERDGTVQIGKLIVQPEFQNKGIGRTLLTAVESANPKAARFELFTGHKSLKNLHLYQTQGYVEFRRHSVSDSLTLIFLAKYRTQNGCADKTNM